MFHQINKLQSVINHLLLQEQNELRAKFRGVLSELLVAVEEFPARGSTDPFFQEECVLRDTFRDSMEKQFWLCGRPEECEQRWRCVEKIGENDRFCQTDDGIMTGWRCVDATKYQIVAVSC